MEKIKLVMKALSHEGFGKPDYYKEEATVYDNEDSVRQTIVNFALKYGVEFDSVNCTRIGLIKRV